MQYTLKLHDNGPNASPCAEKASRAVVFSGDSEGQQHEDFVAEKRVFLLAQFMNLDIP
jgi:hypothetical protein